jgi:hypothetical protein
MMIEDVRLGPRVTPLAMSSGEQRTPQPSNRRATLHRCVILAQWLRSTNAANRGFVPDAAHVFNDTSIKAKASAPSSRPLPASVQATAPSCLHH